MDKRQLLTRNVARFFRLSLPCLITVMCLWGLTGQIDGTAITNLPAEIAQLPLSNILCAIAFTMISLWAVGRYDGVAHRHFQTGVPTGQARLSGSISIAVSQTIGFGLFTSALARWRMLPGLDFGLAIRLSAFVCLSFLTSWAVVTALACLMFPAPTWTHLPATLVMFCVPLLGWLFFSTPHLTFRSLNIRLPSLLASGAILFWAAVDLGTAATALYFLVPFDGLMFQTLLPVFLLALGAALLSGTPGGVGPFELVLLTLLPQVPTAEMLVGIIGFRAIYYAVPAVLAVIALLRPFGATDLSHRTPRIKMAQATRAEIGVIAQNGGMLRDFGSATVAVWPTPQTLTAFGDPIGRVKNSVFKGFAKESRAQNRIACLYKCSARTAVAARALSWNVIHYADDAVLVPNAFDLNIPARRTLRRKIRQAEQAAVKTYHADTLPLRDMAQIDAEWQNRNGPARGGTMGRFSPTYIANQQVFLAYQQRRLIGFVSFHQSNHQWCLDLVRSVSDVADGTMHALVMHAVRQAAQAHIAQISLAATPACPDPTSRLLRAYAVQVVTRSGGPGLRQFKSSFAPRWQPLYVATRSRAGLVISLADIAREVHHPPPIAQFHEIHNQDEDNEVALLLAS
ncbi:MAG: phosphatidylglycerol lysyltransferase domain-containing protein [Sulfitobacter sp.]